MTLLFPRDDQDKHCFISLISYLSLRTQRPPPHPPTQATNHCLESYDLMLLYIQ